MYLGNNGFSDSLLYVRFHVGRLAAEMLLPADGMSCPYLVHFFNRKMVKIVHLNHKEEFITEKSLFSSMVS